MANLSYTDDSGESIIDTANLDIEIRVSMIPEGKEWKLTLIDDQSKITTIDFIGGRPDDR